MAGGGGATVGGASAVGVPVGEDVEAGRRAGARGGTVGAPGAVASGGSAEGGRPVEARAGGVRVWQVDGGAGSGVDLAGVPGEVRPIAGVADTAAAGLEFPPQWASAAPSRQDRARREPWEWGTHGWVEAVGTRRGLGWGVLKIQPLPLVL